MRSHGLIVNNFPTHLAPSDNKTNNGTHSIYVLSHNITIPLQLNGVISYFNTRYPTNRELNSFVHIEMTSQAEWNPYDSKFAELEDRANRRNINLIKSVPMSIGTHFKEFDFYDMHRSLNDFREIFNLTTGDRNYKVTPEQLTRNWGVSKDLAQKTLNATTQLAVRDTTRDIGRRYRT